MADAPTSDQWAELRTMRPQREGALATIRIDPDSDTSILMGMDQAGYLHLMIPVQSGLGNTQLADLNGLKVRHRRLDAGQVLDLCAPPSHEQVFNPFCRDVLDAVVVQGREPWKAVAAMIRAWQSAWKPVRHQMDKTVQVGLFGELLVLRALIIPSLGSPGVDQWSGPLAERHDFAGGDVHIEVKTTRKSRPEHEISRLDQLRTPPGRKLLFVSIQLEESIGGAETIATEVDKIIELLRGDIAALDLFMTKVASLGWSDEMRNSGELLRFFVRRVEIYPVDDEFPRLSDSFEPPSGVVSVRYTIDLANLPSLGLDEAGALLRAAHRIAAV